MKVLLLCTGFYFMHKLPKKIPIVSYLVYFILIFHPYPYNVLSCLLFCIFFQDLQTMFISWKWVFPSLFVAILFLSQYWNLSSSLIALLSYGLPIFILFILKKDWIGSADVCFILYFSILLGYQRMSVAILLATVSALSFCILFQKREVPFLCFLSVGIYISCFTGYRIWYGIMNFLLGVM